MEISIFQKSNISDHYFQAHDVQTLKCMLEHIAISVQWISGNDQTVQSGLLTWRFIPNPCDNWRICTKIVKHIYVIHV